MKRTIIIFTLIIASSISVFSQTSGKQRDKDEKAKKQVMALITEFSNALIKEDTAALDRIISNEAAVFVEPSGLPITKEMVINIFKIDKGAKLTAIDLAESYVRIFGDTAVLVLPVTAKWHTTKDNQDGQGLYTATIVAVKKNGNWKIMVGHYSEFQTRVSPPPQP